ncbi:hypothetical protein CROQUDRAFT_55483, partial [Cronartium quercuum f. sp. fusiforme G11]
TQAAFSECFQCLVAPTDHEIWEELHYFHFHKDANVSGEDKIRVTDQWTSLIIKRYAPSKASKLTGVAMLELGREATPQAFNDSIQQPILLCHGSESAVLTEAAAFERYLTYHNLDPRSKFENALGAPLVLLPLYTPLLTQKYMGWIRPILQEYDEQGKHQPSVTDFRKSLDRLATLHCRETIAERDPLDSSSYQVIDENSYEFREIMLAGTIKAEKQAISLLGEDAPEWWTDASEMEKMPWRLVEDTH